MTPRMEERFDAVVVGGGPAGCLSAMGLARRGLRTAIVDRGVAGRDKCCGHCLNPRVLPLLERRGLRPLVESIAAGRTRSLAIEETSGRGLLELRLETVAGDGGWLVPRGPLDAALWDAAVEAGALGVRPASARLVELDRSGAGGDAIVEV